MRSAHVGRSQLCAEQRRDFAREAENRKAVAPIWRDLDVEHGVVELQILGDVAAYRSIGAQREDAGVILREAQLALRAEHSLRTDAANNRSLQRRRLFESWRAVAVLALVGADHPRADESKRRDHAGLHVGRAAYDSVLAHRARIDFAQIQAVGVRMLLHF